MCGICGILDYSKGQRIDDKIINRMNLNMAHRGPDESGTFIADESNPAVGLGHRRLKIIDLSSYARQPMCNEDKSIWIVFNGEIYNFPELRKILEEKGHKFISHSDTEVILHLYEEEGVDCVKKLRGMFAFAIWDSNKKSLMLARDRFGKKPLLYSFKNGRFSFASEFASLLSGAEVSKEINFNAIDDYIAFGYVPAPETIYKDISKLLPGHILVLKNRELRLERYWKIDYSKKISISFNDAVETAGNLLQEAVKIRLYSDVPLGVFLSGGIDSSTVVALMSRINPSVKIKTFSIGFDDKDFDELKFARIVAKQYNTQHYEFVVKPNVLEILPELVERYGEPYADSSCIPTYYVANRTRKHVTVALNGDGGDELFAGYERYRVAYLSRTYNRLPSFLRKGLIEPIIYSIPGRADSRATISRIKRFLDGAALPLPARYLRWVSFFDKTLQNGLFSKSFLKRIIDAPPDKILAPYFDNPDNNELIDVLLEADTNTYLPNDLLVKMDIATMANSLEARSPFLDHRLAEFIVSLRGDFKMRRLVKKYLLKAIIKDFVPRENINRPKMGFGMPIGRWFRGELKELLTSTLLSKKSLDREYFNADFVKAMVKQHLEQRIDYGHQLWTLMMFELWHRRFIDNDA